MKRTLSIGSLVLCAAAASCALDELGVSMDVPDLSIAGEPGADRRDSTSGSTTAVCGDGLCAAEVEGCGNCPGDCPCWQQGTICSAGRCVPVCGDGYCAPGMEDCGQCPIDCACPGGSSCQGEECAAPDPCGGDPCCGDLCCRKPWLCEPQVP